MPTWSSVSKGFPCSHRAPRLGLRTKKSLELGIRQDAAVSPDDGSSGQGVENDWCATWHCGGQLLGVELPVVGLHLAPSEAADPLH